MRLSSLLLAVGPSLLMSSVSSASSKTFALQVKESIEPPHGWVKKSPAPADYVLELRIGLPQPAFHILESHLYEVSDPSHVRYGAYLSKEEVESLVAPDRESIELVDEWLASHGLNDGDIVRSPAKDWAKVTVPVWVAEKMLNTKYYVWHHPKHEKTIVRTTSYSLPQNLHAHIDLVQPTTLFAQIKSLKSTLRWADAKSTQPENAIDKLFPTITDTSGITVNASCNQTITLSCLKQLYNAINVSGSAQNGNHVAITSYLGQYANIADLQAFYEDQRPDAVNSSFHFVSVDGGLDSQNASEAGGEANLDTQFAFGLTFPTPATLYSTGRQPPFVPDPNAGETNNTNEPYANWLDYVLSHPNPPQTISTSYGDDEQTVPLSYAHRTCNSFAQLGARGVSLLFSSGDGGVGDGDPDPKTQTCFTRRNITHFAPRFPSSCPYVTSVGATSQIPEVAANFVGGGSTGGGFSNYFSRPPYQDAAVEKYLSQFPADLYQGLFNRSGRGIPDVSAQGDNFRIFYQGAPHLIGGTSASTPAFAGFVSLLNDVLLSKKLPPLGFLNPLLYSKGLAGLNDITTGNNPGCGTQGFNATKGWDPVTGLGTPNFGKLKEVIL